MKRFKYIFIALVALVINTKRSNAQSVTYSDVMVRNTASGSLYSKIQFKTDGSNAGGFLLGKTPASSAGIFPANTALLWNASGGSDIVFATTGVNDVNGIGSYVEQMRLTADGRLGLGTPTPNSNYKLEVNGHMGSAGHTIVNPTNGGYYAFTTYKTNYGSAGGFLIGHTPANAGGTLANNAAIIWNANATDIVIANTSGIGGYAEQVRFRSDGKICVGNVPNFGNEQHKLYVADGVRTERVKVDLKSRWGDYVFEPTYNLTSLSEIETYIKAHKHLPGVPSAATLAKEGLDLAEMHKIQMVKIEELTLHTIAQEKKIKQLEKEKQRKEAKMSQMEKKMAQMMKRLEALEKQRK